MPPGLVVSHLYLLEEPAVGSWFESAYPPTRDEAFVLERYALFLRQVHAARQVWALSTGNGLVACPAHREDRRVALFFGAEALACVFCNEGGFEAEPERMPLDEFINDYLPSQIDEGSLIGTNWTPDLVGIELEPVGLRAALARNLSEVEE